MTNRTFDFAKYQRQLALDNKSQVMLSKLRAYFNLLLQMDKLDDLYDFLNRLDTEVHDFVEHIDFSQKQD